MLKFSKVVTVLIFLCLSLMANDLIAGETIVTNNGTRISGEITGFENGYYQIQIGRFIKRVAANDVRQIIDDGGIAEASVPALPAAISSAPIPAPVPTRLSGSGQVPNNASSYSLEPTDSPKAVLDKISDGNPALSKYMEMQKSNGVSSDAMMTQVKQMQGNPAMLQMMSKFKDPAFQQKFLANITKMKEALNPNLDGRSEPANSEPDQNVEVLKGLFEQLNNAKPQGR